jgi:hypothetical protein
MLAEIFILRLEIAARAARRPKEGPPKERFVPFSQNSQFTFKDSPVASTATLKAARANSSERQIASVS